MGDWYLGYDERPGMDWNIHIYSDENLENRVCFMANAGDDTEDLAKLIAAAPAMRFALGEIREYAKLNDLEWLKEASDFALKKTL